MNERQARILELVAEAYIRTARPVASAHVAERLGLSSATVRSEFGVLEEEGLLHQPHTSAGRVPTAEGFRRYADHHLPPQPLATGVQRHLLERLQGLHGTALLRVLAGLAADLSGYAVVLEVATHDSVHALELHLTPLAADRVLVVAVLEGGMTRQWVVKLDPAPDEEVLDDAERTLRQLTVPLGEVPTALRLRARQVGDELGRTLDALADSWPRLLPPEVISHGFSLLCEEPEARDPAFLRRAAQRFERGAGRHATPSLGPLALSFDEDVAMIQADLAIARRGGWLTLIGPTRMRYPAAFMVADGVRRTVASLEPHA